MRNRKNFYTVLFLLLGIMLCPLTHQAESVEANTTGNVGFVEGDAAVSIPGDVKLEKQFEKKLSLPQTGEQITKYFVTIGILIVLSTCMIVIKKKRL